MRLSLLGALFFWTLFAVLSCGSLPQIEGVHKTTAAITVIDTLGKVQQTLHVPYYDTVRIRPAKKLQKVAPQNLPYEKVDSISIQESYYLNSWFSSGSADANRGNRLKAIASYFTGGRYYPAWSISAGWHKRTEGRYTKSGGIDVWLIS
jgi:hypothetical protein